MSEVTIEEILYFLSNRNLTEKTNNFLFSNITLEQMKAIKIFLSELKVSLFSSSDSAYEDVQTLQNILYDCAEEPIDELLDWKRNWQLPIELHSFATIHILNLQVMKDIEKLKLLNQSILRTNSRKMCFHLYTNDQSLKTYFTPTNEALDRRDHLLPFNENKALCYR